MERLQIEAAPESVEDKLGTCRAEALRKGTAQALDVTEEEVEEAVQWHSPPLPAPSHPPPGLPPGLFEEEQSTSRLAASSNPFETLVKNKAPALVASFGQPSSSNPLLGGVVPTFPPLGGTPHWFQGSLSVGEGGRIDGRPSKTRASFGESLGSWGSTSLATDRIIHAIDGLRKAQDEDKTGSKGTLRSVKPEKLDVFLARGCGETQVELCPGVYGKELFHGIKRAGHHAKHTLQLIRWPFS